MKGSKDYRPTEIPVKWDGPPIACISGQAPAKRTGKTLDGKSVEVRFVRDGNSYGGHSEILIDNEVRYKCAAPYAPDFMRDHPQAVFFLLTDA